MKDELAALLGSAAKELFGVEVAVEVTRPDPEFGDFATNVAMQIAGRVAKNPREIADVLRDKLLGELDDKLADVTVAGPGFLNLKLSDQELIKSLELAPRLSLGGKTVVCEYSDPNPFKPLHAGHLYTTLVGDTISRLIENAGARVIRLNFGGDVGLHVGKSLWAIVKKLGGENPEKLDEIDEGDRPAWLGARYVEGNQAYEADESAKAEIIELNRQVYEIQASNDRDSALAKIYWTCRTWSYDYFASLYSQLEVKPFDRFIPESEVTPLGEKTVKEELAEGIFEVSDGAVIFDGEKFGLHKRVFINSQGLPTYETKDVGLSLTKWQDYHFDESIIITASEQADYMRVVIKAIEQFAPEPAARTRHLTHGIVKLAGGIKISSRKGNGPSAVDILQAARTAGAASGTNPSEQTILAAVKYALVKNRLGGDVIYDPAESVALEGNSGPYLQYAHARARSILTKAEAVDSEISGTLESDERSLVLKISEYKEVVELATAELMPHHICTYLYELAQEFNRFYEKNRVIGDPRQQIRLALVDKYAARLKDGLELLGITAPDKM